LRGDNGTAWWRLGNVLLRAKQFDDAQEALLKAIEYAPEDPEILVDLANVCGLKSEKEKQLRALKKAVERGASARAVLHESQFVWVHQKIGDSGHDVVAACFDLAVHPVGIVF
jgi:Flp pilus assembly protein TadD